MVLGQNQNISTYQFINFNSSTQLFNPSETKDTNSFSFHIASNQYIGALKNVGFHYGDFTFKKHTRTKTHNFGAFIHSEFETDLLSRTHVHFRYAWETTLTKKLSFAGGVSLGMYNYLIKSTFSSAGNSFNSFDANLGTSLKHDRFNVGLSINHLQNNEFNTPNLNLFLRKNLNLIMTCVLLKKLEHQVNASLLTTSNFDDFFTVNEMIEYIFMQKVSVGFVSQNARGAGFTLGIKNFELNNSLLDLNFSYINHAFTIVSPKSKLNNERIEIMLSYRMVK